MYLDPVLIEGGETCPECGRFVNLFVLADWDRRARELVRPFEVMNQMAAIEAFRGRPDGSLAVAAAAWRRDQFARGKRRYVAECRGCDDWQTPAELQRNRGRGDCEDHTGETISQLCLGGLAPRFVLGHLDCSPEDSGTHAWVEGEDQYGFFLIEATNGHLYRGRPDAYQDLLHVQFGDPEQLPWRVEERRAAREAEQRQQWALWQQQQQREQQQLQLVCALLLGRELRFW